MISVGRLIALNARQSARNNPFGGLGWETRGLAAMPPPGQRFWRWTTFRSGRPATVDGTARLSPPRSCLPANISSSAISNSGLFWNVYEVVRGDATYAGSRSTGAPGQISRLRRMVANTRVLRSAPTQTVPDHGAYPALRIEIS